MLGVLIKDPRPLRLPDVSAHPESYGFPPAHPPMHAFLGVPIVIEGRAWGNLYLTEKAGGAEFTAGDEDGGRARRLGPIAIATRLYRECDERATSSSARSAVLETTTEIGRALGGETDLGRVLELVAERARTLIRRRPCRRSCSWASEAVERCPGAHRRR